MNPANWDAFSIQMYENSSIKFAVLKVELDANEHPVDMIYVYCNDSFVHFVGRNTKEECVGQRFFELFPLGNKGWLNACYEAAYNKISTQIDDISEEIGKHIYSHLLPTGKKGYSAILIEDISAYTEEEKTQHMQMEKKQQELTNALTKANSLQNTMHTILGLFGAASWTLDYDEHGKMISVHWSDELRQMLGYTDEKDYPDSMETLYLNIHPDDLEKTMLLLQPILQISDQESKCDTEVRIKRKNGEYSWYRLIGKASRQTDNMAAIFYGVIADVNDRKKMQLSLQETVDQTEHSYRTLHRLIKSGMWNIYFDKSGNYSSVEWSDEFRRMIGYTNKEDFPNLLKSWSSLLHPDDWAAGYNTIAEAVFDKTGNTQYDVEYRLKTKDRGYRWFRATGDVYRREDGSPYRFYGVFFDIDDQKRRDALEAEKTEALRRAQTADTAMETLHAALGSASWSMDYDENGNRLAVHWSKGFREMLGFQNKSEFADTFEAWFDRIHPEDQAYTLRAFNNTVEDYSGNTNYDVEYRLLTKNKGYRWFHAVGRLVRKEDGTPITFYGLLVDINEQKKADLLLEETRRKQAEDLCMITGLSHEYYVLAMIHTKDFSIKIYRDFSTVNIQTAVNLLREAQYYESFMRQYIEEFVAAEDRARVSHATAIEMLRRTIPENGIYTVNYHRLNENGTIDHRQMAFSKAISEDGEENWAFGFRDINKLIEEEQKQKRILEDALTAAEQANQSKTKFLFNMSHDIRTPMNAILGFSAMAKKYINDKEKVLDSLTKVEIAGEHLLRLINDVLDMARIESGKVALDPQPCHIPTLMKNAQAIFGQEMKKKDIDFTAVCEIENEIAFFDQLRIAQIELNLISNALKYTPNGGKVVYRVTQVGKAENGYATYRISVKDTGIGMSKEFVQKVFEAFERERTSTVDKIQGTGLGLAIVKALVEQMGGTITCESELGVGTEFIITLSFRIGEEKDLMQEFIHVDTEKDFTGKHILLVEDNELNREIAHDILTEYGFVVDTAEDGIIAVDKVAQSEAGYYDLILMDIQMPNMDGYEASKRIRALEHPELANIPIIAMTANAFEEDRRNAIEAGMNAHVGKPIDLEKLFSTVAAFIE